MTEKSALEQFTELREALINLYLVICKEMGLVRFMDYLKDLLDD